MSRYARTTFPQRNPIRFGKLTESFIISAISKATARPLVISEAGIQEQPLSRRAHRHEDKNSAIRGAISRVLIAVCIGAPAAAQNAPPQITTPDEVETSVGTLTLKDGVPSTDTAQLLYDRLDLSRGIDTVLNAFSGVSMYAIR